jgi:hypothetical protein
MSRATPQMRNFAKRLIKLEANGTKSSTGSTVVAFPVPEKLRPQLTTLMGSAGFRALLSRALALAKMEEPWLRAIDVNDEGVLQGWEELEKLTVRLVREVWPKLSLDDLNFEEGEKNEQTSKVG